MGVSNNSLLEIRPLARDPIAVLGVRSDEAVVPPGSVAAFWFVETESAQVAVVLFLRATGRVEMELCKAAWGGNGPGAPPE